MNSYQMCSNLLSFSVRSHSVRSPIVKNRRERTEILKLFPVHSVHSQADGTNGNGRERTGTDGSSARQAMTKKSSSGASDFKAKYAASAANEPATDPGKTGTIPPYSPAAPAKPPRQQVGDAAWQLREGVHRRYQAHHWGCLTCIGAGQGRGDKCSTGADLWSIYETAIKGEKA